MRKYAGTTTASVIAWPSVATGITLGPWAGAFVAAAIGWLIAWRVAH